MRFPLALVACLMARRRRVHATPTHAYSTRAHPSVRDEEPDAIPIAA